jgi:hypothetical protein
MRIPTEIVPLEDSKLGNFFQWGWRKKSTQKRFGDGDDISSSPRGDFVPENY